MEVGRNQKVRIPAEKRCFSVLDAATIWLSFARSFLPAEPFPATRLGYSMGTQNHMDGLQKALKVCKKADSCVENSLSPFI